MFKIFLLVALCITFSGCVNTTTYYDKDGNVTRVEKNTDFSRAMTGTNSKSQMILLDGRYFKFEVSATAGDNCTPGASTKYMSGKAAIINAKKDVGFAGTDSTVEKFFAENITVGAQGVNISSPAGKAAASGK